MKKKNFLLSVLMASFSLSSVQMAASPQMVPLEVGYDDPTIGQDDPQRGPVLVPNIGIDGFILYFDTPCDGCLLRIVDDSDNVVYSTVIPADATSLVLPAYLTGNYELQIVTGFYYFYGDITL